ncbi:serine threonine- kinase HT1-like [Brachionus plicatilis]|uniref:Serine threonine-kinase HT1-like n=1 Tax=Brachionus plicatilis TaxID=10195 RepID=A0A3M7PW34_BRAPC|nr:serine threonine- kinase HT1-like [Brachionus plicatilis]
MAQRHENITCALCYMSDFKTYRYKCLTCQNFDLCGFCFERHKETKNHKLSHLMFQFNASRIFNATEIDEHADLNLDYLKVKFENFKHKEACETCSNIIKGIKLKCDVCFYYYQCIDCFEKKKITKNHKDNGHPMIVCNDTTIELDINRLELLKELGKGAFGSVHLAKYKLANNTKIEFAVKKIVAPSVDNEKSAKLIQSYCRELDVHNQIKGENILQMVGNCMLDSTFYIATNYIKKGSLRVVLEEDNNFGPFERFKVAFGMICGIDRMHKNGYVHRDIKPDNVLITEDYCAKIADFGIAKIIQEGQINTFTGTFEYMPPEFFKYHAAVQLGERPELTIDELKKIDIFACGLNILEIFYGIHGKKNPSLTFSFTNPIIIKQDPKYLKKLIVKCLSYEPSNRPTIGQILDYLNELNDFIQYLRSGKLKDLDSKNLKDKTEVMEESCKLFEEKFSI